MNATKAAGRAATAAVRREPVVVPDEVVQARRAVCESNRCGRHVVNALGDWCQHKACGCFLPLKRRLATERCPEGLWPGIP